MALIVFQEIIDIAVMVMAVGFIFKDRIALPEPDYEPLKQYARNFFGKGFKDAVMVAAPAVVLHEAGHKIAAMSYGFNATIHAAYEWLGLGVLLKLINAPLLFFVPGYVSYSGFIDPLTKAIIAFAGPLVNLLLFAFAAVALRQKWLKKQTALLVLTKQINLFLFIFNMLPLFDFDGNAVFSGLMQSFG